MIWRRLILPRPVRPGYWFAQKRYGPGAVPATWQGWAITAAFAAALAGVGMLGERLSPVLLWLAVPLALAFALVAVRKTDGGWRWRWGAKEEDA